jgi:diphosphomevalonate decarboxylase
MVNSIEYIAPSNIALIKYWGKRGIQIPQNPSLSFTLSHSRTTTKLSWEPGEGKTEFLFEGEKAPSFEDKILKYRKTWEDSYPFLKELNIKIESKNSFPHSAGIASSASSMASLSLCFTHIVSKAGEIGDKAEEFYKHASHYARLGSGSACRSLYGGVVTWGQESNEYASQVQNLPESWKNWGDAILIVSSKEKPVSSRQGHALMEGHPYAATRYAEAKDRLSVLIDIMREENLLEFCELVEREALELHGLMMNSSPSFILMKPESLSIIEKVREFRKETNLPICFTLDAGPNIHLLYPLSAKEEVKSFIEKELQTYLEDGRWIDDQVGEGPVLNG